MSKINKNEIVRLTEEYGGQWGINHTCRLLKLIAIIGKDRQYNADVYGLRLTCTIGEATQSGHKRVWIIPRVPGRSLKSSWWKSSMTPGSCCQRWSVSNIIM
jgi:hypothetical protein